jgi:hypothetical protein
MNERRRELNDGRGVLLPLMSLLYNFILYNKVYATVYATVYEWATAAGICYSFVIVCE